MKQTTVIVLILFSIILPRNGMSFSLEQIEDRFSPLVGEVVAQVGNEYLVTLSSSQNISPGDILTHIKPGEPVRHPITNELLGTLDISQGYLETSRVQSVYSFAKLIYSKEPPAIGDKIRRFEKVPAIVIDKQKHHGEIVRELKKHLPHLEWQLDVSADSEPLLFFILDGDMLAVRNSSDILLYETYLVDPKEKITAPVRSVNGTANQTPSNR